MICWCKAILSLLILVLAFFLDAGWIMWVVGIAALIIFLLTVTDTCCCKMCCGAAKPAVKKAKKKRK